MLVVGAGALGCAAARTLAQDPSVAITLVDDDRVELSNLQRQVLYDDADIGRLKVEAAAARLARDFGVRIATAAAHLDAETGPRLVAGADLVIDATDHPPSKFLIGRLCVKAATPYIYGGVARTGGQWMLVDPGASACLECVFPSPDRATDGTHGEAAGAHGGPAGGGQESAAGCSTLGILAPVAGMVGAMQAIKALTFLHRPERAAAGRLHVYELAGARARHVDFAPDPNCFCRAARPAHQSETGIDSSRRDSAGYDGSKAS